MRGHGRSAGHGLNHDKTEGLRPVDREQERSGISHELRLLMRTSE
jgi:hypothetical protein